MKRSVWLTLALTGAVVTTSCETTGLHQALGVLGQAQEVNLDTIVAGLKEALHVGTQNAVATTSKAGGFSGDKRRFIHTPPELEKVAVTLRKLRLGQVVDDFEEKMNRAAEEASGQAVPVFVAAIRQMTFQDAHAILQGDATAATDYFRARTSAQLRARFAPIVAKHMERVGAIKVYNDLLARYRAVLPFAPRPKMDVDEYVTEKALDGLFVVVATEERKIRENPAARTTELLRRVFARQDD